MAGTLPLQGTFSASLQQQVARPASQRSAATTRATRPPAQRSSLPAVKRTARPQKPVRAPAVAYRKVVVGGIPLHVVQVDPRRPEVRIAVATSRYGIGYRDTWSAIIDRVRPAAAITGTYFDTKSAVPVGSIVVGGRAVHRGGVGTAFAFAQTQGVQLVSCRPGTRYDWAGFETVLRAGPRLLTKGQRTLWPRAEGFRDPAIFARKKRTAVAVTRHGKLLLVAVQKPVLLRALARALQKLGAVDAMCLDGGSSSGLYYRGKSWVVPRRSLTNVLVIYDSPARYRQRAPHLIPGGVQAA